MKSQPTNGAGLSVGRDQEQTPDKNENDTSNKSRFYAAKRSQWAQEQKLKTDKSICILYLVSPYFDRRPVNRFQV